MRASDKMKVNINVCITFDNKFLHTSPSPPSFNGGYLAISALATKPHCDRDGLCTCVIKIVANVCTTYFLSASFSTPPSSAACADLQKTGMGNGLGNCACGVELGTMCNCSIIILSGYELLQYIVPVV